MVGFHQMDKSQGSNPTDKKNLKKIENLKNKHTHSYLKFRVFKKTHTQNTKKQRTQGYKVCTVSGWRKTRPTHADSGHYNHIKLSQRRQTQEITTIAKPRHNLCPNKKHSIQIYCLPQKRPVKKNYYGNMINNYH